MTTTTPLEAGRQKHYDEDLLVRLIAEGKLSYRKIAPKVGLSVNTVSCIARGRKRRDLFQRICRTAALSGALSGVASAKPDASAKTGRAHRRTHRLATNYLWSLVAPYVREALEGTGQAAQECREFLVSTFFPPACGLTTGPHNTTA